MEKITKEMLIGEIMNYDYENDTNCVGILLASGMHCIGCHVAPTESLEEACMVHGIDVDILVDAINEYLGAVEESQA